MSTTKYSVEDRTKQFLNGWAGERLLKEFSLDAEGVWEIIGEGDENGYKGSNIGLFSGKLSDIIAYAVSHKDFWSWGRGGEIKRREVHNVTETFIHKENLRKKREALLAEAEALQRQIES